MLVRYSFWRPRPHFEARAKIAWTCVDSLQGRRITPPQLLSMPPQRSKPVDWDCAWCCQVSVADWPTALPPCTTPHHDADSGSIAVIYFFRESSCTTICYNAAPRAYGSLSECSDAVAAGAWPQGRRVAAPWLSTMFSPSAAHRIPGQNLRRHKSDSWAKWSTNACPVEGPSKRELEARGCSPLHRTLRNAHPSRGTSRWVATTTRLT